MNDTPLSLRDALARMAVPLAALAAMAALAGREIDPVSGAESWYLAILATGVLLASAFLARAPAWEAGIGAMLATAAVWSLPAGPGRGAVVVLLLVGSLAVAAARRLAPPPPAPSPTHPPKSPGEGEPDLFDLSPGVTVPLALGLQILLRGGELLFQPQANVRMLVALLVLPVAAAVATTLLAQRHGSRALIAAGAVVVLAPGWNVAATLGLVALAAADLADRPHTGRITRLLAVLVVLAPIAWEPIPGLATVLAALLLVRPRQEGWLILAALVLAVALFAFTGTWTAHLALPFLIVPGAILADRMGGMIMGLILASVIPLTPDFSAMAGPLALMALSMASSPEQHPFGREGRGIQATWTITLLGATALLASYPWLRAEPMLDALDLFGLGDRRADALVIVLIVALASLARAIRQRGFPLSPSTLAAGVILVAAWIHLPATGTLLVPEDTAVVVDAARPRWQAPLDGQQVRALVIESSLSNGASLDNGTAIATVRLRGQGDRTEAWVLRAGADTGEWAARRPDVAASSVLESPPAWISWVAGDFFGQRYRVRWVPDRASFSSPLAGPFTELTVERNPGLPKEVSLAIHRVEVRH